MTDYGMSTTVDADLAATRARVEEALSAEGFGVLTEIDVAATLKKKLDKDVPPHVILGACNPVLADRALSAEPSIGLLLPCNVVLRDAGDGRTLVEMLDPGVMVGFTGNTALEPTAAEARRRLETALAKIAAGV